VAAAITAATAAGGAHAATTVYTSQASFLAQVSPGSYTEAFTGGNGSAVSYNFSGGGFGYTISASTAAGVASSVYRSGSIIGNNLPAELLTVTFTAGAPTAVGGNFYITDITDVFQSSPVTLNLSDGTSITYLPGGTAEYRGFVSTVPITSLTMAVAPTSQYNTLDNLTVGIATVVPEPATYLMMALGLTSLLMLRRSQQQRS
jgi:hypothetical protein